MKLLNTYDNRDDAYEASRKIIGERRVASERDSTVTIYNLFGVPSWGNFFRLDMYHLAELNSLLVSRSCWRMEERVRHEQVLAVLQVVSKNYDLQIPAHWL